MWYTSGNNLQNIHLIFWYLILIHFFLNRTFHLQETTRILLFGCLSITAIQTEMESSKSHGNTSAVPHQISRIIFMISSSVAVLCICCICWDYLADPHWPNVAIILVISVSWPNIILVSIGSQLQLCVYCERTNVTKCAEIHDF